MLAYLTHHQARTGPADDRLALLQRRNSEFPALFKSRGLLLQNSQSLSKNSPMLPRFFAVKTPGGGSAHALARGLREDGGALHGRGGSANIESHTLQIH